MSFHNKERKAERLNEQFIQLARKIHYLSVVPELTKAQRRSLFIAMRNLRRTYDDLRRVRSELRLLKRLEKKA